MLPTIPSRSLQQSFREFIRKDPFNRRLLIGAIAASILQLILFKLFYPYASYFFTDSFAYLHAAVSNQDANVWPVGYSKFLRVFNTFFHSDLALVGFQYLFLQLAGFYFLLQLTAMLRPSRTITLLLWIFFTFQPVFLYIANSVSSDALFIGLSMIWLARLLRMMYIPSRREILVHALLVTMIFTIRYNAMIYPLIAALAIGLSRYTLRQKLLAIFLPVILIGGFVIYTGNVIKEITGIRQFSPFSGWQIANNALYMYGQLIPLTARNMGKTMGAAKTENPAKTDSAAKVGAPVKIETLAKPDALAKADLSENATPTVNSAIPPRFASLDSTVRKFYARERYRLTLFDSIYPGIYFQWSQNSPLMKYAQQQRQKDTGSANFISWATVSPLYADYGTWLIKQHPAAFAQYYLWPNTIRFALPPLEFMDGYNSGMDTVDVIAKYWFHYKDNRVHAFSGRFQHSFLSFYRLLNLLVNAFFLGMAGLFFGTRGIARANPLFRKYLLVITTLWTINFFFSISAAPVVLRYQLFLLLVSFSFSLLLVESLLKWEKANADPTNTSDEKDQHTGGKLRVRADRLVGLRGREQTV
ncbi:MAG TPA: hypothetical protein VGM30_23905 [Puia sp.]|jgi:hypothetical protein